MRSRIRVSTTAPDAWLRGCSGVQRRVRLARDHDLGRLDDRERLVAAPELQLLDCVARDDRRQRLIADAEADLREEPLDADLVHVAAQLIAAADRDHEPRPFRTGGAAG